MLEGTKNLKSNVLSGYPQSLLYHFGRGLTNIIYLLKLLSMIEGIKNIKSII
jgi:hypothetical protein